MIRARTEWLRPITGRLVVVALAVALGCGSAAEPEGTTPAGRAEEARRPPPSDPWAYFPTDVRALVRVDTAKLERSPYSASLTPLLARLGADDGALRLGSIALATADVERLRSTKLVMAAEASGEEGAVDGLLVVRGGPSGPAVETWLRDLGSRQSPPLQVTKHDRGSLEVWSVGPLSLAEVTEVEPGFLIAGTGMTWERMLDRALGRPGGTPKDDAAFMRLCEKVSCETAMGASVGALDDRARERVSARARGILPGDAVDHVQRYGVRVEATQGIDALLVAEVSDAPRASGIAGRLDTQRRGMLGGVQGMLLRAIGATTLIEAIAISADGADVHTTLALSDEDARRVRGQLDRLIEMAEQGRIGVSL
jgi:hypothetical protein